MKFAPWGMFPNNKKPVGHVPYWAQDRDPEIEQKHLDAMRKVERAEAKYRKKDPRVS